MGTVVSDLVLGTGFALDIGTAGATAGAGTVAAWTTAGAVGAAATGFFLGLGGEYEKNRGTVLAQKERLDALRSAELTRLNNEMLDVDLVSLVKEKLLVMRSLVLDSEDASNRLQQEFYRLKTLHLEKEDLERRRAQSFEQFAASYSAAPLHRLKNVASLLRAEASFSDAQRWMYFAVRAAEYKWNMKFRQISDQTTYTVDTVFRARNARELEALHQALTSWSNGFRGDRGGGKRNLRGRVAAGGYPPAAPTVPSMRD